MPKLSLIIVVFLAAVVHARAQPALPTDPFLLIGCEGHDDNEIITASSKNGIDFTPLGPAWKSDASPVRSKFMRDHSLLYYKDKTGNPYWLCAYSTEFHEGSNIRVDAFGLAKSDDLVHWTQLGPVVPGGFKNRILHVWGPYLFQDPRDGAIHVFVLVDTDAGWAGIGSMKCLDPGTWAQWTDWKPFEPIQHNSGKYRSDPVLNGAAVYYLGGKYWVFYDDATGRNGYPTAEAYITSSSGLFSGYGAPTYIPSLNSTLGLDQNFLTTQPKQFRYEGMSLVWVRGATWRIYVQAIGKVGALVLPDIIGFVQSDDNMETWGGFTLLGDAKSNLADYCASHVYRIDTLTAKP
jgi:hypothetical protein